MYTYNFSIVDGGWGVWVIGPCSKTCGGGIRSITRKCNNPKPLCNGKQCEGESSYAFPGKCNDFCCPGKNMNTVAHICTAWEQVIIGLWELCRNNLGTLVVVSILEFWNNGE